MYFLGSHTTGQPNRRIAPLFQVSYDRSLCKPLGTISDFSKLKKKGHKEIVTDLVSRSPSPVSLPRSPSPPQCEDKNPPAKFLLKPTPKKNNSDARQNALTIFEFSTAYPFIFSNNKFKCFVCAQPYLDLNLMKIHMSEHAFTSMRRLVNNRKENVLKCDVSDLMCKLCSIPIKDLVTLKLHLKEFHLKPVDTELQDNLIPFNLNLFSAEGYQCVICEQYFIKLRILVIHMSAHFSNYSCEICGSGFMTLRLLKKHLEVHEAGNFPCDRCEKTFLTSYKRALHIRGVHLKLYPRRCPICPERFNSNYKRTIHLQDVHNQSTRVHKCKTCGRGFNLKYHLICHIRSVHLQERNQQCDICHQRFCNKESLKRHMVIHTGEKNHKCEVCGMAFLRRKNLKDHLRLHDIN